MTIMDYIQKGGVIMYILLLLSIIGITIIIFKIIIYKKFNKEISIFSEKISNNLNYKTEQLVLKQIKDEISLKVLNLEKGVGLVKTISTLAPLLGLLGTVIGILSSFEKIASKGMDTSFFASGISLALITTIGGLVVAIPHIIGYNYLIKRLDEIELSLEKEFTKNYLEKKWKEERQLDLI